MGENIFQRKLHNSIEGTHSSEAFTNTETFQWHRGGGVSPELGTISGAHGGNSFARSCLIFSEADIPKEGGGTVALGGLFRPVNKKRSEAPFTAVTATECAGEGTIFLRISTSLFFDLPTAAVGVENSTSSVGTSDRTVLPSGKTTSLKK